MKRTIAFLLLVILLISCSPSTMTSTVTPTQTVVAIATIEPTMTPTSIPTIQVNGLSMSDPHITNPELFDLSNPDSPIPQFVASMKMAGIDVDPQRVVSNLAFEQKTSVNGNCFVIGYYSLDPDPNKTGETLEGKVPLLIATRSNSDKWTWRKVTLEDYRANIGINIGTQLGGYGFADYYQDLIKTQREYFDYGMINTSMDNYMGPNTFMFKNLDSDYRIGIGNGMKMFGHSVIWPSGQTPEWLKKGNYTNDQIRNFLKEWVTTIVLRYPEVNVFNLVNEPYNNDFFQHRLGNGYIIDVFRWAREARPDAKLIFNYYANQSSTDKNFPNGQMTELTKELISKLSSENLIDGARVEMILFADKIPSSYDITETIRSYGLPVYITEFQVVMTNIHGTPEQRQIRQAEIYKDVTEAILSAGNSDTIIFFVQSDKVSP